MEEEKIFLPTLHWFAMTNPFTGSCGALRFKIVPKVAMLNPKEVDFQESSIFCEIWHGPFCYEKSEMEAAQTFPMSEEGREQLRQWLMESI